MIGEAAFINLVRALPLHEGARGLVDDAAVLDLGERCLVLTHDMMVQGVHFRDDADMADVAWKLVATNLSDLAAKGAKPVGVLLGMMLGADDARFAQGLGEVLEHFGVPLLGGDTVRGASPRSYGLTAIGEAVHTSVPSRASAKPGDSLWLTGAVGAAMMGFEALDNSGDAAEISALTQPFRRPNARVADGLALAPVVSAMMDVSDGVLLDAFRMAHASGLSVEIDHATVPIAAPEHRRDDALRWGDDYELLFAMPEGSAPPVHATKIGVFASRGAAILSVGGMQYTKAEGLGWQH